VVSGWVREEEFAPVGLVRVRTESSIWLIGPSKYHRLPQEERPRATPPSDERRLDDAVWHGMRRCWWITYPDGRQALRILPIAGPPEGLGVVSGLIVEISGDWEALTAAE
jgi:hypothetical protein